MSRKAEVNKKSQSRVYRIWTEMRRRCNSPHRHNYKYYGAKGIKVCERWNSFLNFYEDMGEPPYGMTIDRIDSTKDYAPENCRWYDIYTQNNNRSQCRVIYFKGVRKTITEWARYFGIKEVTLYGRLFRGWSFEQAILIPVRGSAKAR